MTYLTADQAAAEALAALHAAGITRGARVTPWLGMQPLGAREVTSPDVTVRAADYHEAIVALLRAFPDGTGYSGDGKRRIRIYRQTGRIVGEGREG